MYSVNYRQFFVHQVVVDCGRVESTNFFLNGVDAVAVTRQC